MNKKKIIVLLSAIVLVMFVSVAVAMGCCMDNCCCKAKKGKILVGWACACDNGEVIGPICYYD